MRRKKCRQHEERSDRSPKELRRNAQCLAKRNFFRQHPHPKQKRPSPEPAAAEAGQDCSGGFSPGRYNPPGIRSGLQLRQRVCPVLYQPAQPAIIKTKTMTSIIPRRPQLLLKLTIMKNPLSYAVPTQFPDHNDSSRVLIYLQSASCKKSFVKLNGALSFAVPKLQGQKNFLRHTFQN